MELFHLELRSNNLAQAGSTDTVVVSDEPRHLHATIVTSADDAILAWDLFGMITSWNDAALHIFGYTAKEIVGRPILFFIPEELQSQESEIFERIRIGKRVDRYETERIRKNGERFPVSITCSTVRDGEGRVIGASAIVRELEDRKGFDYSRFRLAAIVESADDAIISKDLNGIIESWNEGAHRMFGFTSEEMIGQPMLRLIPAELHHEENEILRKLRAGERIDHFETTRVRKNGEKIEVSVTISPIKNANGEVIGASKVARDISDRKRMESLLLQSEKLAATGRMAAAIAHEINNPLESLINLIYLARQNCSASPEALGYLITAEGELERVSHLARQALGYYRDTGSPSEVHLRDLVENVLTVYRSKLLSRGISVVSTFNDPRKISVSQGELLQVFSNVIANAIDAMRQGGKLTIDLHKAETTHEEGLLTTITDDGIGINKEHLGRIFEPFFTTKGNLGTGIGLWVTRQLLERRGGQISVSSSTAPGNSGTSVTIYIPFVDPGNDKAG